jgi:hypothetical protein
MNGNENKSELYICIPNPIHHPGDAEQVVAPFWNGLSSSTP